MRIKCVLLACSCWFFGAAALHAANEVPGEPSEQPIALVGATIHPISGPGLVDGTVVFQKGQIVAIGKSVELLPETMKINLQGKHVYPGLFDAFTQLGLMEINLVPATVDTAEIGPINPSVKTQIAVNPDSELIPVSRANGVLLAVVAPGGSSLTGMSSAIQLDGWTPEELTLKGPLATHLTWPQMLPRVNWHHPQPAREQLEASEKSLADLRKAFAEARAYARAHDAAQTGGPPQLTDARWEALRPVLDRKLPVIVTANELQQIESAVAFSLQENVRLIIHGGYDAPRCAKLLKRHDIPVIIGGIFRMPLRNDDDYDAPFTLPEQLRVEGIHYCISGFDGFTVWNVRNLPYHAAMAVAHGLSREEALKSITMYPAQILGLAERVGSLEVGKDATLFVSTGDPLETQSQVMMAFVQGRRIDLANRHTRLYEKYQEKYRRLNGKLRAEIQ